MLLGIGRVREREDVEKEGRERKVGRLNGVTPDQGRR